MKARKEKFATHIDYKARHDACKREGNPCNPECEYCKAELARKPKIKKLEQLGLLHRK